MKGGTYYINFSVKEVNDLAEYKSNSNKSRDNENSAPKERHIEPVITGTAVVKERSTIGKIKDSIIAESFANVISYLCTDVVIPSFKALFCDLVDKGARRWMYGKSADARQSNTSKISYGSYFNGGPGTVRIGEPSKALMSGSVYDYGDIFFNSRGDAEAVLESMCDLLEFQQVVSVGDLYDLSGVQTTNYLVNNYGWTSLIGAKVMDSDNGYFIKFQTRAKEIKK